MTSSEKEGRFRGVADCYILMEESISLWNIMHWSVIHSKTRSPFSLHVDLLSVSEWWLLLSDFLFSHTGFLEMGQLDSFSDSGLTVGS